MSSSRVTLRRLLWVDCVGAFVVGALLLVAAGGLSGLLGFPAWALRAEGAANVAYGLFSSSLARRAAPPRRLVLRLAALNVAWGALATVLSVALAGTTTPLGTAHLLVNAVYVGGLGLLERRVATSAAVAPTVG